MRLQNWICDFQDAKMMEDESIRSYIGKMLEKFARIWSLARTEQDDEVICKIQKILTPPFKQETEMIQLVMPCTKYFTKETLLRRLESLEEELRQSGELAKVEIAFSSLKI